MRRRTLLSAITVTGLGAGTGFLAATGRLDPLLSQLQPPSTEEVKQNAERISYQELYRNISEYEGSYVHYGNLRITDVISGEDTKKYLLMFNDGGYNDDRVLYGVWNGDPFRENDDVELWGIVRGLTTYTSLGGERSVPKIKIRAMNRLGR